MSDMEDWERAKELVGKRVRHTEKGSAHTRRHSANPPHWPIEARYSITVEGEVTNYMIQSGQPVKVEIAGYYTMVPVAEVTVIE